jgi:hypothetical protein
VGREEVMFGGAIFFKKNTAKTAVQLRGGDEVMFGGSKRKYIVVMRGGVTG